MANLRAAHDRTGNGFPARTGVKTLLAALAATPGISVAIATGDWQPTISYKLACAGIDVSPFPMATASDAACRTDIIRLAIERAGRPREDAVYIGDGVWDLRACRQLGLPFIGTGARIERLLAAGAQYTCATLDPAMFLTVLAGVQERQRSWGAMTRQCDFAEANNQAFPADSLARRSRNQRRKRSG